MVTSFLPFLEAIPDAAERHGFGRAFAYKHLANTDELHVTLAHPDGERVILFDGQLLSDFADEAHRERVLKAIDERIATEAGPR